MKILLVSNMFPGEKCPRFGVFVANFKKKLENLGVVEFPHPVVIKDSPAISKITQLGKYIRFTFSILYRGLTSDSDLIYAHFPTYAVFPLAVLTVFKKQIVLNFHGNDLVFNNWNKKLSRPLLGYIVRNSRLIVVPSDYYRSRVQQLFNAHAENIYTYPSGGIDHDVFKRADIQQVQYLKEKYGINASLIIGFISNFIIGKGWKVFLQACSLLKEKGIDFKAVMIGDGPDRYKIIADVNLLGLEKNIIIISSMPQENLYEFYSLFHLYIFPTIRIGESLGLVGLEAMACGTPTIASNIGGPTTYIRHGENGLLFKAGNPNDLVNKIQYFIKLPDYAKELLIKCGFATAAEYDAVKVTIALYNRLTILTNKRGD